MAGRQLFFDFTKGIMKELNKLSGFVCSILQTRGSPVVMHLDFEINRRPKAFLQKYQLNILGDDRHLNAFSTGQCGPLVDVQYTLLPEAL